MAAGFKQATVNASDVPSTQTNFPSYVDLSRLGITTLAEAQSVRVYADSGKATEWAREIVSATEMWVKVPSLTSTVAMYVDWDGVASDYAVTDTYGRNAVWNGVYLGVYHFENTPNDMTGNAYNFSAINGATYNASGKIGATSQLDGVNDHYRYTTNNMGITNGNITMSLWIKLIAEDMTGVFPQQIDCLISKEETINDVGYAIYYEYNAAGNRLQWNRARRGITDASATYTVTLGTSNWHKLDFTYDGTTVRGYYDGAEVVSFAASGNGSSGSSTEFAIGRLFNNFYFPNAYIDEVRIASNQRSADWLTTEYNNQSDEAGFWGTWTDAGGGGSTYLPRRRSTTL